MIDVIVVGGGPAGLEAALMLGRARRRVLLCDAGQPRNSATGAMHGFLSRDGLDPAELCRIAVDELRRYPTVERRQVAIESARPENGGFIADLSSGGDEAAHRLILATGVVDELPGIPGLQGLWGRAAFHCTYCDAFELGDQPLAVIDAGATAGFHALQLSSWSPDVVLCTNGTAEMAEEDRIRLSARGIPVRSEPVAGLEKDGDGVRIVLTGGPSLARRAIFIRPPTRQRSELAARLACRTLEDGSIEINEFGQTSVPGVFAAGDMARRPSMPFAAAQAIHAASAGAIAAVVADRELLWAAVDSSSTPAQ